MNRSRFLRLSTAGILAASFSLFAADEALPKAETLLDRYIEVTGGKQAYLKHKSEHSTLSMEFVGKGLKGTGVRYADSNNNVVESITMDGIGKLDSGVINGVAWDNNPMTGPRLVTGAEKADRLRAARFNGIVYWRELYKSAETTGSEQAEGEDCYKVVMTPTEGKPETVFFSKKSGLIIKRTTVVVNPMGEIPVEMLEKDYKDFDGVKSPSRLVQKVMGNEIAISRDSAKYNVEIPAGTFDPPAEVKKLMAK